MEKAMAPHSSTLAWKIPWTEEPGRLQSMGSLRVGHDWATSPSLFTFHFHALEKEMATHSSILAWRIPGTEEPSGLRSMGSHRVRHDWSDLAAAAAAFLLGGYCCSFKCRVYSQLACFPVTPPKKTICRWSLAKTHTSKPMPKPSYYYMPPPTSVPSCPPMPLFLKKEMKARACLVTVSKTFPFCILGRGCLPRLLLLNPKMGVFLNHRFGPPIF